MRVLVTGGAGFIGSHTCVTLLEKGYEIVVIDSFINSYKKSLDRVVEIIKSKNKSTNISIEVLNADIRDENTLVRCFSDAQKSGNPIKAVLHFAGLKSVQESILNPISYWDANVNGSTKLLSVMDRFNCRTIVFSSSATIYGSGDEGVLFENTVIKPINPYGRTKVAVEQLLKDTYISNSKKWRVANLRYFNPIGAHSSGLIGESPLGVPDNVFPYLTQVAAGNLEKLFIFGNDWSTTDGTGVRDYIHVMDLAEGHISTLEYLMNSNPQIINLNLGTQIRTSVLDLIDVFERVNKIKIPYEFKKRRPGDCSSVIANISLAKSIINWTPKRDIESMCIDGWKWQSANPLGYK